MNRRNYKCLAIVCVTIIIFSIFLTSAGAFFSSTENKKDIVLIEINEEENIDYDKIDLEIIDSYGNYILGKIHESSINRLKDFGIRYDTLPKRTEISVKSHSFDFTEGEPDIDSELRIERYNSNERGLYIVHMLGPINPEWRKSLENKGVEVINYVPNYAYEVRMTPEQKEKVEDLFFIDWIGIYHPGYKLSDNVRPGLVDVRLAPGSDIKTVNRINSRFSVLSYRYIDERGYRVTMEANSMDEIKVLAKLNDVYYISNHVEPKLLSEVNSQIIGGGAWIIDDDDNPETAYRKYGTHGAYINQLGFTGKDVVIAIADTGIGNGTVGDAGHSDFTGRVIGGYNWHENSWADGHSHGTHVTGLASGDTYRGTGVQYAGLDGEYYASQGLASDSNIYALKVFDDEGNWIGPEDLYEIFENSKLNAEAYIHSNSWGNSSYGNYTDLDETFDQAVRDSDRQTADNQPMVITISAGNEGSNDQTINSPGNAKNVITVGATESYMPDAGNYGYHNSWGVVDNPDNVWDKSSRGWSKDNRIKPDVVSPGYGILSTMSPDAGYGSYSEDERYEWKQGTSMSTPIVAGATAVIVEWYESNFGIKPSPAMVKSLMINTAYSLQEDNGDGMHIPNRDEGWGMVNLPALIDSTAEFFLKDQTSIISTGETHEYTVNYDDSNQPLKVSLVWTDKEAEGGDEKILKNNLDLEIVSPSGDTYRGNAFFEGWTQAGQDTISDFDSNENGWDDVNNIENVYIHPDDLEVGTYTVRVHGENIPEDGNNDGEPSQDYALVIQNAKSEPIRIDSDEDLEITAENHGWTGDGTEQDPYIIEGYDINGTDYGYGLYIGNVTDHFIVRNCTFKKSSGRIDDEYFYDTGLYLHNTINGRIEQNTLTNNNHGILIKDSSSGLLSTQEDQETVQTSLFLDDYDNVVINNTISENEYGVKLENSEAILVYHNNFINNNVQASDDSANDWNNDYPVGGNYWSEYIGEDTKSGTDQDESGSDGIGDTHHDLDTLTDDYPLIKQVPTPHVRIETPEEDETIQQDEITAKWTGMYRFSDTLYYELRLNEGDWIEVGTDKEYIFEDLQYGDYTLEVRVRDEDGFFSSNIVNFTIKNINVDIISPQENEIVTESNVNTSWDSTDADYHEIRLDEADWINVGNDTEYTFEDLKDGDHTVDVRVEDESENKDQSTVNFTVDTRAPNLDIISPEDADIFCNSTVIIDWIGADETSDISHYEIRINKGIWQNLGRNSSYTYSDLEDGEHNVEVKAVDNAGLFTIENVTFITDTTPPIIEIKTPEDFEIFTQNDITIEWIGNDETSGLDHYKIRLNRGDWQIVEKDFDEYVFTDLEEGEYVVEVKAVDKANNTDIDEASFIIDTSPPSIEITTPAEDKFFDINDVTIEWTGFDEFSEVDFYEIRIDEEDWVDVGTNNTYTYEGIDDGSYIVYIKAIDRAGNRIIKSVSFTVDTSSPSIEIISPHHEEKLEGGKVTVEWIGEDEASGIAKYEIRLDNGEWIEVNDETYTFTNLDGGKHTVEVKAWDEVGHTSADNVTFSIEAQGIHDYLPLLVVVTIIIFLIIGLYIWNKYKNPHKNKSIDRY